MKLEAATFLRLRRLAPVLDVLLGAGEVEHADQASGLASLSQVCSLLARHTVGNTRTRFRKYGSTRSNRRREGARANSTIAVVHPVIT
jgi:hypothetical protein